MKLRLFAQLIIPVCALIPLGTLHAQAQGPGMQEMAIGSALFAAGEKAELLIAQSMAPNAPASAESSLVIRDAKGDTLATVDLPNLAAYVAPSEDGIMRWINAVTVEVSSGILVVNGQAFAAIEEDGATSTPFFSNYRPQFYFRTTDVTGSPPQVTLNILGPGGGTRATRSVSDGYWIMLPPLTPSADTATPVSVPPTESIAFTYQRIERSSSAPMRSESAALMFVDPFGRTLGSVDLPDGDSGTIAAAVDGGVLTVNGEALGPLVTDPNTGRLSFGFYIMLDNQGANAVDGASARRSITITVFDQAGGETRSTYNCQLVDGQLPPGLTITGCAT